MTDSAPAPAGSVPGTVSSMPMARPDLKPGDVQLTVLRPGYLLVELGRARRTKRFAFSDAELAKASVLLAEAQAAGQRPVGWTRSA